jgi:hypothetical protein
MKKLLVLMAAAIFVAGSFMPAMAAEAERSVSFYGNLRMNTFWIMADKEFVQAFDEPTAISDDDDLFWGFDRGSSRFGVLFAEGDITANVEIRPDSNSYFRQWNASWKFGPGTLVLGQTWDPSFTSIFGCCFDGGPAGGYGGFNGRLRQPQIAVHYPVGTGTFKVAAMEPYAPGPAIVPGATGTDTIIPTLAFSIDQTMGGFYIKGFGNYNTYKEDNQALDRDYSIDSWALGIQPSYSVGPFKFNAMAWIAQNSKGYQVSSRNPFDPLYVAATESIEDVDSIGFGFTAVFRLSDAISFEAGYSWTEDERDFDNRTNNRDYWYINMPWQIAKGISLTPEFGILNDKDDEVAGVATDQGKRTYIGAYWMISF